MAAKYGHVRHVMRAKPTLMNVVNSLSVYPELKNATELMMITMAR
jgi:hypothetical protein